VSRLPHGAELESGTPLMITEGNFHLMVPPSALVQRSADGITVTANGVTRKFSTKASIVRGGEYHRYEAVKK
jgi:hypothetical protein